MSSPVPDVAAKLRAHAARFVKENRLPGAAVGVVHGDELAWSDGIGYADREARRATDSATLHRIASITKTFTGTAIMQLRDAGQLDLDDPAVKHLPELSRATAPFGPIEAVTIRRMLSHESGLASEPPGTDWASRTYEGSPARNLERAEETGMRIPANRQWKYSNLAYQLLGEIVARVSRRPYVEYVRGEILNPLGMDATSFEPLPAALAPRLATAYDARFLSDELVPATPAPMVGAEGGLCSCVDDLARWISFQLGTGGEREGAQVLSGPSLVEMHTARYLQDPEWTCAWGIAWYAVRRGEVIWVQHSGGLPGFITTVCFDPKERVGAIALLNGIGDAEGLAMDLAGIARDAVVAAGPPIELPPAMPPEYSSLLGLYLNDQGEIFRLEWRDGMLTMLRTTDPAWKPTLRATGVAETFVVELGFRQSGETVRVGRRSDGRVLSIFKGDETLVRLEPAE